jgi:ribose/xylose/arabinose/galactoside ABC-type transport system permease subunit
LTLSNGITILASAAVLGIVSTGQVMTIISGGFDISVSGVVPLGSVMYALMLNEGRSPASALLIVLLAGAAVGVVNGVTITVLKINPLIATLATMSIAGGIALSAANGVSVPFNDPSADGLTRSAFGDIPNHVWIFLGLAIFAFFVLRNTTYGRQIYAVGGSRDASRLAGMRTEVVTGSVYVISGTLAALAGAVIASQLLTGVGSAGADSALTSIAAVVLGGAALTGGVGGIGGTFIGVIILSTLSNGLAITQVPSFYQQIATGVVLLVAVALSQIRPLLRSR